MTIAIVSRSLLSTERNYGQIENETLAIIQCENIRRFMHHHPLLSIYGSKKVRPTHTANRPERWVATLLIHDYKMEYLLLKK